MGLLEGWRSLARDWNKVKAVGEETAEGVVSDLLPELELKMPDSELISLKKKWELAWSKFAPELEKKRTENENYWLGKHFQSKELTYGDRAMADNLIFEALETFLPIASRQNPQPLVEADNSEEGHALADRVQKMLAYLGDTLRFKLKLKKALRHWALYYVGVAKIGWSEVQNEIDVKIIRPQKLMLDPNATISEGGEYTGEFLGEARKDSASNLVVRFPKQKQLITEHVKSNMGTEIQYIEWWTNDYLFWTLENHVLDKVKNPHWNYDQEQKTQDAFGFDTQNTTKGVNHFKARKKPYVFLSIFNLGKHPWDDTSLIEQSLANQDLVNKRLRQIDRNADSMNGGSIVSGDHFTKEEADRVDVALRRGGTIWVPRGDVNSAYKRETGKELPGFVYNSLLDYRNELRNIFGTRGSTPQGTQSEQTVRGKIIVKGQDEGRIGGGISEYLEQFADSIYNWFVQLMYVYYDEKHSASVLGNERAKEYVTLRKSDLNRQLLVSVKEGSMIPQDSLTRRNEAINLWSAGALDPITLFDRLEFPNPREAAKKLYEWKSNPASLFPDLMQEQQQMQAQQQQQQMEAQNPPQARSQLTEQPPLPDAGQAPISLSQVPIP